MRMQIRESHGIGAFYFRIPLLKTQLVLRSALKNKDLAIISKPTGSF